MVTARRAVVVPGVIDALAARVVDEMGFEALCLASAASRNRVLGRPDVAGADVVDLADRIAQVREVTDRPLVVDDPLVAADGERLRLALGRIVRAGADALVLRDADVDRPGPTHAPLVSPAVMAQRVSRAVDARLHEDTLVVARTEARGVEGFDAAVDRAGLYAEAGADVVAVAGAHDVAEVERLPGLLEVPMLTDLAAPGWPAHLPRDRLEASGYALVLSPDLVLRAALLGMRHVLGHLERSGRGDAPPDLERRLDAMMGGGDG